MMRFNSWFTVCLSVLLLLVGCPQDDDDDVIADDDTGDDDDTADDDDDDTGDDDTAIDPCEPFDNGGDVVTLDGTLLTPLDVYWSGEVSYSRGDGTILCVGDDCSATTGYGDGVLLCTEGIITPGIIDPHNHMQYNHLPRWEYADGQFWDRYDWQQNSHYWDFMDANDIQGSYNCEIQKWAEARLLIAGTTSVTGTYSDDCLSGWVRDLDGGEELHGIPGYDMDYYSSKISYLDEGDASGILDDLDSGDLLAYCPHIAEGWGDGVRWEFDHMAEIGLMDPGVGVIHGTDQSTDQFISMLEYDMTLIWSPRSNLALYDRTTPVHIARQLDVRVALGTDWTPSGSLNQLDELSCATRWDDDFGGNVFTDEEMLGLVTERAARAAGIDGVLGVLEPGYIADIAVFAGDRQHPYEAFRDMETSAVRATIVGGEVVYGDADFIAPIEPSYCESLDVCGVTKTICMKTTDSSNDGHDMTLAQIQASLEGGLLAEMQANGIDAGDELAYAYDLYPLFECDAPSTRFECAPGDGALAGDADGDGVADGEDGCPDAYDPEQWDLDGDGAGDVCDTCPMDPADGCSGFTPGDTDGDGVADGADLCPHVWDDGTDSDGDGKGDACDLCPQESNPGNDPCTYTIPQLRDPAEPGHPFSGNQARIASSVVTAIYEDTGFYVTDPAHELWGGIYIYTDAAVTVSPGDEVEVDGEYQEYYHLSELGWPDITVLGSQPVPAPWTIADPADVANGGALAEAYESQLITVGPVTVVDSNPDDPSDYGEFAVDGNLRVGDQLWADLPEHPAVGTNYTSITGVLTYTFGNYKLLPRDADDLIE